MLYWKDFANALSCAIWYASRWIEGEKLDEDDTTSTKMEKKIQGKVDNYVIWKNIDLEEKNAKLQAQLFSMQQIIENMQSQHPMSRAPIWYDAFPTFA